jgi:endonuclease YncB( thermonuclease family)
MRLFFILLISLLLISNLIGQQSFEVTQIYNTNLFKLDNGEKIKLYGLYIPSESDTSQSIVKLSKTIFNWEQEYLLGKTFEVEFVKRQINGINEVNLYVPDASSKENLAKSFLSKGYAVLSITDENEIDNQLLNYQENAQKNGAGIWSLEVINLELINEQSQVNPQPVIKNYERPYLPLLSVSAVLMVLT